MPKYRVLEVSFIGNQLRQPGSEIDYDGEPGANLEPVDRPAKEQTKAVASVPKKVADLVAAARMHAATRGDLPSNADGSDLQTIVSHMPAKPTEATLAAALTILETKPEEATA